MSQESSHFETRQNYDRLSRWYDLFSSSERRVTKEGLNLLYVKPGEKVLEIGCGTGHALIELAGAVGKEGYVGGVDISPGMVSVARQRVHHSGLDGRIWLKVGDATHLPYSDHQFQVEFMSFTLELFEPIEIPVVLLECWRVLQPGGRLCLVSLVKKDVRPVAIYEWFHLHFPRIVDCRPILAQSLLETAGFEIVQALENELWGLPVGAIVARKPS
jgi:ubiquinone/menaquinone biosynthesis C-methylase UbiE